METERGYVLVSLTPLFVRNGASQAEVIILCIVVYFMAENRFSPAAQRDD